VAVQQATDLARTARAGEVLVSEECVALLASSYRLERGARDDAMLLTGVAEPSGVPT
jgi:hypothetical protein